MNFIQLPLTTQIIVWGTNFILAHWALLGVSAIVLVIAVTLLMRIKKVRYAAYYVLQYLPIAGMMSRKAALSDLSRTMGLLLKSGLKIVDVVETTSESISNPVYGKVLKEAIEIVTKGDTLNSYFNEKSSLFPIDFSQMVEVGENTGTLETNLFYLAEFYGDEVAELTKNLSSTLEPILLLVMGVIVGFIAVSIITPIYQMTQAL